MFAEKQDSSPPSVPEISKISESSREDPNLNKSTESNHGIKAKEDEATDRQEKPVPERSAASVTIIILALCVATFLAALDVTVITTALPEITKDLRASQTAYTWIGSAYLLTYSAISPFWAKCSDIFGRKPILLLANVIFLVGSLICALSYSPAMLIAGRAIQGAGGGGLIILVNITISDLFSMR